MVKEHPLEYKCAEMIKTYVQSMLDISISNEELLYLIIHIARIVQENMVKMDPYETKFIDL
uniref:PRD domain-containing protein n=1 Tax=Paenibacillus sp. FSL R5-0519 TaxID=2921648 RepID=UPI00403F0A1C